LNTIKIPLTSNLINLSLYGILWPPPFPNEFVVLVLPKTIDYNVSSFFSAKSTKLVEPQTLKVTNFEIINL
jgi:hypothetical protein